jgi:predicted nuclease with TOPRIM domain
MSEINTFEPYVCKKKPIDELRDEVDKLKMELSHIKNYVKKIEARESVREDKEKALDAGYEKVKSGWWW